MDNYYFVAPSLPLLVLGEVPDMTFKEVMHRLEMNLDKRDLKQVAVIRRAIDLQNIQSLSLGLPLDDRGNLSEKELNEALLVEDDLPDYVFAFLNQFDHPEEKARHYYGLLSQFYAHEIPKAKGFLKKLLTLQYEMRLILCAMRAKKMGRDIVKELQFEDFTDPLVAQILAQKDMDTYQSPMEFKDLVEQLEAFKHDPWQQHKIVIAYEFVSMEEMAGYPLFSIDWILGYVARLILVERENLLDPQRGEEMLDRFKTGS